MIVFYGVRSYGKAAQIDDEYALTRWFHVYWVPIVPISSAWMSPTQGQTSIGLHGRSVGMVYARVAALIGAFVALGLTNHHPIAAAAVFAAAAALAVLSWRWRRATAREQKRARFHRAIYSQACPPEWLPRDMRARLKDQLDAQWATVGGGRTPEDVARLGARDGAEAAAAYMILTLAGAHADADRIVDGQVEPSELGGPFRGVAMTPEAGGAAAARPRKIDLNAPVPEVRRAPAPLSKTEKRATVALVGLGLAAATAGGIALIYSGATRTLTPYETRYGAMGVGPTGTILIGAALAAIGPGYLVWRWFVRGRSAWKQ